MKFKFIFTSIILTILILLSNNVIAVQENIDIVNIPGQTSVCPIEIPSEECDDEKNIIDNEDIVNIPGQTSVEVYENTSKESNKEEQKEQSNTNSNIDIVNIPGQTSVAPIATPTEDRDDKKTIIDD